MPDVGSSETELRRPTCPFVQVIIGPQRHGGLHRQHKAAGVFFVLLLRALEKARAKAHNGMTFVKGKLEVKSGNGTAKVSGIREADGRVIISKIENFKNSGNTRRVIAASGRINKLDSIMAVEIKEFGPEDGESGYSAEEEEVDYHRLINKPDMVLTNVSSAEGMSRVEIVSEGLSNAAEVGQLNENNVPKSCRKWMRFML